MNRRFSEFRSTPWVTQSVVSDGYEFLSYWRNATEKPLRRNLPAMVIESSNANWDDALAFMMGQFFIVLRDYHHRFHIRFALPGV